MPTVGHGHYLAISDKDRDRAAVGVRAELLWTEVELNLVSRIIYLVIVTPCVMKFGKKHRFVVFG